MSSSSSSSHTALIVDADPKGLDALVYGFQGADWRITACPTPETASLLVKAADPSIVVMASRTDHEKAYALIRQIRAKEAFRTLPLLVLGPEDLRKSLKDGGDVDLLPLPAFVRDVLTASQLLVEAGAAAAQKPGEEPCIVPAIASTTTLSLIRTMCGLARSGMLQLERRDRHGEILFHEGELTAAQVGQLQGMAAVQHVLIWNDGALKLHLRPVARRGQLHQTAQEFIEEFDRFQRDFAHAMKDIGPPETVYSISEERLQHSTNAVPAEVTPVVRLCDGRRTLSDIIDDSPFRVLDTVRIVARLVELAILMRRDPKPPLDASAARPPLEEFWATARIVGPSPPSVTRTRQGRQGAIEATAAETPLPIAPATPPVQSVESEVRDESGAGSQGKGHTRKKTLEIPTTFERAPAAQTPPAVVVPAAKDAVPTVAAPTNSVQGAITARLGTSSLTGTPHGPGVSPVPTVVMTGTQTSGVIQPRERRTQSTMRAVPAHPSVVVDTAQLEVAKTPTSAAIPSPEVQSPAVQSPLVSSPVVQSPVVLSPVVESSAVPSPVADGKPGSVVAKITGEFQVAPSRKTTRQMPGQPRMSIHLDATLVSGPEAASVPAEVTSAPKIESNSMRLTGEIKVAPSEKHTRHARKPERASSSFHIDPSLIAEAPLAAKTPPPRSSDSQPVAVQSDKRHQSGNFSPLEKDFFERESEIYEAENTESFSDLEENRAKAAGKNGTNKKPDRPKRK